MAEEKKSYGITMSLELVTEDGETVKAVNIHNMQLVRPVPLHLWCDFLERLGRMTTEESVMIVAGGLPDQELESMLPEKFLK